MPRASGAPESPPPRASATDATGDASPAYESVSVRTDDGWRLFGERRPRPDAKAVVVVGHAMMVDRRTLDRPRGRGLASALFAHGLEVVCVDARGHGESGPRAEEGGRWTYDDFVRFDVPAMVRLGRDLARGRPVVLMGHSLIAHAGLIAAGLGEGDQIPDALVAFAPNLWAPKLEPSALRRALKGSLLLAWATLARVEDRTAIARRTSLGTDAESLPYILQARSMWRRDALESPDGAVSYEAALGRARLPVLAFSSEGDRLLARPDAVARFLALADGADIEHRVVRGADAPDHMGFVTDPRSRPLWDDAAGWIRAVVDER